MAIVMIAVGPALLWWSRLPDEIAVHWDRSGHPDGHMSRVAGLVGPMALAVLAALIVSVSVWRVRATAAMSTAALAAFFAGLFAAVTLATVLANRDEHDWKNAELPLVAVGAVVVGAVTTAAAVIAGLRPSWLARFARQPEGPMSDGRERVAWAGGCHSRWVFAGGAAVSLLTAAALAVSGALFIAIALAALGALVVLCFGSVRVTVGANGVRVTPGTGWPHVTIPLASIDRAEAISVNPLHWGGWGYRGSLRLIGRAAWVLRRGEGLQLDLTDGRTFAVTVDNADEAAAVLNDWLTRASSATSPS